MTPQWEGEREDAEEISARVLQKLAELMDGGIGEPLSVANEFTEVEVRRVDTRNGSRLLITSPKSGRWITLDALEVEALTWQNTRTLAAMVGNMYQPLLPPEETAP
jgi:hypothetical protein